MPVLTLWKRELVRFWREKSRVMGFVGSPLIFWFVIGSGFGNLEFFFPGALTMTVMFSAIFSTMSLIEDRREGFLLSMLVSPAPRSSMVLGKVLGSTTLAWLQGMLFLLFALLTNLKLSPEVIVGVAGALFLVSFTFTVLGFLIAWQNVAVAEVIYAAMLVLFPLWMVSGALFPEEKAHGWMKVLMKVNPMTYGLAALRRMLDPLVPAGTPSLQTSLIVTAACGLLLLAASAWVADRRNARDTTV